MKLLGWPGTFGCIGLQGIVLLLLVQSLFCLEHVPQGVRNHVRYSWIATCDSDEPNVAFCCLHQREEGKWAS